METSIAFACFNSLVADSLKVIHIIYALIHDIVTYPP